MAPPSDCTLTLGGTIQVSSGTALNVSGTLAHGTMTNSGLISGGSVGVYNYGGTIGTLTNSGTLTGYYGLYNIAAGSIVTLTNTATGLIHGGSGTALGNAATIDSLINAGLIDSNYIGVYNFGTIVSLTNSGTISSGGGWGLDNAGSIGTVNNSGVIDGYQYGVKNGGTIDSLSNTGSISAHATAVYNSGSIGTLSNGGQILADTEYGIYNDTIGSITLLTNTGTIEGVHAMENLGAIGTLDNSGLISSQGAGVINLAGTIGNLTNSGTITGETAVYNSTSGSIGTLSNSGLLGGTYIGVGSNGTIGTLTNTGVISGPYAGVMNYTGSIVELNNSGTITGRYGFYNYSTSTDTLQNSGLISGTQIGVWNSFGTIGTLANSGTIASSDGIALYNAGSIGSLDNSGTISGPTALYLATGSTITGSLLNSGLIAGNINNVSGNDLSIAGGSGSVVGTLTGASGGIGASDVGYILNAGSNVVFSSGNILLNDNIVTGNKLVTNSANLQVNNPININGSYQQTSSGNLVVGVTGLNDHGELLVSSAATIDANGRVALTRLNGYSFAAGQAYTLVEASNATYNVSSLTAAVSGYSGGTTITSVTDGTHTDLVVCLIDSTTTNCSNNGSGGSGSGSGGAHSPNYSVATTPNAVQANNAAGRYAGSNAGLTTLANAVVALGDVAEANKAGTQLLADPQHAAALLAVQPTLDILNVVGAHADTTRLAMNADRQGIATGEAESHWTGWGEFFGGSGRQDGNTDYSGYSMTTSGLVAGGDAGVADTALRVGGVMGYTHATLREQGDRTGDVTGLTSYGLIGYGSYVGQHAYTDVLAGILYDDFDTRRAVDFTGFSGTAVGSHGGTQYVTKAEGGWRVAFGAAAASTFTPLWGVTLSHLDQRGYTEHGSAAALDVAASGSSSAKGELGFNLQQSFTTSVGYLVPEVRALYRHEFVDSDQRQAASFAADETSSLFSTQSLPMKSNTGVFSAGLTLLGKSHGTVALRYDVETAAGFVNRTGSLRVRWGF